MKKTIKIIFVLNLVVLSSVLFAQKNKEILKLADTYWKTYSVDERLSIDSITEDEKSKGVVIVMLHQNTNDFLHFLISSNGKSFVQNDDGKIIATFDLNDEKEERKEFLIKLISTVDDTSQIYKLLLLSNSNKYWSSRGAKGYPNWITVKSTPYINFTSERKINDWIYIKPTKDEIQFAQKKWGDLKDESHSNYESAIKIAKSISDDLYTHIGTPSDSMKVRPFEQYKRMVNGMDKGFCSNFAHIFIHACNSLGIPARRIHLQKIHSKTNNLEKISVRMGGMHSTIEIFDNNTNQWVLMDYYLNSLGFYLGKEGPLNATEFVMFLNNPTRRERLMLHYYDPKTKVEKIIPISENPRTTWGSYDGKDTELHYFIKKD